MAHLKKIDQNVPNDEQKVATSVLLYKVMLFKMPQKTPQHFAYFCKWKNVAKIFQVSAHTVSVTWARWMESKQRFRARLRRRKWKYIYIYACSSLILNFLPFFPLRFPKIHCCLESNQKKNFYPLNIREDYRHWIVEK